MYIAMRLASYAGSRAGHHELPSQPATRVSAGLEPETISDLRFV